MVAFWVFLAAYALSGCAALLYEVAWSRLLTLHLGHTEAAVSTVLAAFMGGLAIGASVAGRFTGRLDPIRALRAYAWLELAVGTIALLVPTALDLVQPWLVRTYADGTGGLWFGTVRFATSLFVLTLPTAAMGATFPLAVRWLEEPEGTTGRRAGAVYAANTLGAAVGAGLAGFVLLPALGLRSTELVGASLNGLAALAALGIAHFAPAVPPTTELRAKTAVKPRAPAAIADAPVIRPRPWLAGTVVFFSGFVALAYEVTWSRLLILAIGPTVYAISLMLATFIAGLAGGAALATRALAWVARPSLALAVTQIAAAGAAFVAAWLVHDLPLRVAAFVVPGGATFAEVLVRESLWVMLLLLPMATALGAAFPFAVATAIPTASDASPRVALIYAMNTIGAILGALTSGFVLIPLLGLHTTVFGVGALALVVGASAAVAGEAPAMARGVALAASAACLGLGLSVPAGNPKLLSAGSYKYASLVGNGDLRSGLEAGTLLYYQEGTAGTVSVRRLAGTTSMSINGKVDASNGADMLTQKLLAHLPLLLHPNPKDVAVVGLGSGVTAGATLRHGISRADVLEISPEVVEASSFFSSENHGALRDPRTQLIVGDGRTHLILASRQYDVIISEPSNPWMAGLAPLFTREFFAAAKRRLRAGGLFCQWAHTYDISADDLKSIIATFAAEFPDGSLWLVGEGDVLLIGSNGPVAPLLGGVSTNWSRPAVGADLAEVGAQSPFNLLALWVGGARTLGTLAAGATIQTDDHAPIEYSAPLSLYGVHAARNAAMLREAGERHPRPEPVRAALASAGAEQWRDHGDMLFRAGAESLAYEYFTEALRQRPGDEAALRGLARAATAAGRLDEALELVRRLVEAQPEDVGIRVALSRMLAAGGRAGEAIQMAESAIALAPTEPRGYVQLASVLADLQDRDRLAPIVAQLEAMAPDDPETLYYRATSEFLNERFAEALRLGERAASVRPGEGRVQTLIGASHASLGNRARARSAFEAAIAADPRDPTSYTNLGQFELQGANPQPAAELFAQALALDPASPPALLGLAAALELQGQPDRAVQLRRLVTSQ